MKHRGASLIWALIMSTAFLFVAVTAANFIISESHMSIRMDDSARAYAAAESGMEWAKYYRGTLATCSPGTYNMKLASGDSFSVVISCSAGVTKITSTGSTSANVNRKIEFSYGTQSVYTTVKDPVSSTLAIGGSYVQQFDYWTDGVDGNGFARIGIGNATGTKAIYFKHTGDDIVLEAINSTVSPTKYIYSSENITKPGSQMSEPYSLRIRIEYYNNLLANMIVSERNDDGSYSCISPTMTIDLRKAGISPVELTKFYYLGLNPSVSTAGDGASYNINYGTKDAYFDNMVSKDINYTP